MKSETAAIVLGAEQEIQRHERIHQNELENCEPSPMQGELTRRQRLSNLYEAILPMVANPTPYEDKRFVDGQTSALPIPVSKDDEEITIFLTLGIGHDTEGVSVEAVWGFEPGDIEDKTNLREGIQTDYLEEVALNNLEWSLVEYQNALAEFTDEELLELGFPQAFVDQVVATRT